MHDKLFKDVWFLQHTILDRHKIFETLMTTCVNKININLQQHHSVFVLQLGWLFQELNLPVYKWRILSVGVDLGTEHW
jgi:hypothetical protein